MGSPFVVQVEMCVDPGVAFGDRGGGVLHSVVYVSPCGWHPTGSPVHFRPLGWPHGSCDACGRARGAAGGGVGGGPGGSPL